MAPTALLRKDVQRNDRGESRRLTFDERNDRRMGKNRESRDQAEQKREDATAFVNTEFNDELQALFAKYLGYCQTHHLKVVNLLKFLERAEIEVAPGNKVMLLQLGSIVKTAPSEVEVTLMSPGNLGKVLFQLQKIDGSLMLRRDGNSKIKVSVPPITTELRTKAAKSIELTVSDLRNKLKGKRASAIKTLSQFGVDDHMLRQLTLDVDANMESMTKEKILEMDQLAEEVKSAGGADESDA
jgi:ribosome recycling factor